MKIAIVGAGIMGRLLGWQLVNAGHSLTLFDHDPANAPQPSSAAIAAAGMLAPYSEMESAELPVFELGLRALILWKNIANALPESIDYIDNGSLIVAHPNDLPELNNFERQINHRLGETQQNIDALDQHQLAQRNPSLASRFNRAIYFGDEACLSPVKLLDVLKSELLSAGAIWRQQDIPALDLNNTEQQFSDFDWVIDTRGLGANRDLPTLRGVRGETILLHAPEVNIDCVVRLMHPRYKLYIAPRQNHHYIIGATQIESHDEGPITLRSTMELLSAAYTIDDGFAEARIIATQAKCRPALPDNLPVIERDQQLIRINGLYRHGVLISPALSETVLELVNNPDSYASKIENLLQQTRNPLEKTA